VRASRTHQRDNSAATQLRDSASTLAGGFDLLVCGLPIAALGVLFCLLNGTLDLLTWTATPIGAGVVLWGAARLAGGNIGDKVFKRHSQECVALATVMLALSPFLYWWRQMPKNFYFTLNALLFAAAFAALLFAVNRASSQLCLRMGSPHGAGENKSVVWLVFVAWALPLCVVTGFAARASFEYTEPIGWVLRKAVGDAAVGTPRLLFIATAQTPIVFTCGALMVTRRRVLRWAAGLPRAENRANEHAVEPTPTESRTE